MRTGRGKPGHLAPPGRSERPTMMDDWKPIETAPKDGTRILLFQRGKVVCGSWDEQPLNSKPKPFWSHDRIRVFGVTDARENPPTHWMPLPPPPAETN